MTPEATLALLGRGQVGVLSTSGADGAPYGVPVHYLWQDGKLWFHGLPAGEKLENIARDHRVCFTVWEFGGILTEGAEGSRVFTRNRISAYVIPRGERVRPVDTVGAGDSFTAAFCAMLAAGYDIWPAQAFASKVAAFVCSCAGATPEYPAAAKTEFSGNL